MKLLGYNVSVDAKQVAIKSLATAAITAGILCGLKVVAGAAVMASIPVAVQVAAIGLLAFVLVNVAYGLVKFVKNSGIRNAFRIIPMAFKLTFRQAILYFSVEKLWHRD